MCQRPSIIFYWAANNMCSLESVFYLLSAAGMLIPKLNRQERVCAERSTQASNKVKNAEKYLATFFIFLCFSAFLTETDCVYEVLSLTSNSCKVSVVVRWYGEGAESLKEPVAPESAGRRGVHLVICKGVWQQGHPSRGICCYKALRVLGCW